MTTEGPHYGSEALRHNDEENWRAYCESEKRQGFWLGVCSLLLIGCALCFLL